MLGRAFPYGYALIGLLALSIGYFTAVDRRLFWIYTEEDHLIEYLTVAFYALAAGVLLAAARWSPQWFPQRCLYLLAAAGCLFFVGEELSWGYRWLESAGVEYEAIWNSRKETNLHNIPVFDFTGVTILKDAALFWCLVSFVVLFGRKRQQLGGVPVLSTSLLFGFLLVLLYHEADSMLPVSRLALGAPQALLLLIAVYAALARQGHLLFIALATAVGGEALVYVNRPHSLIITQINESFEFLLSAAWLLYALELLRQARSGRRAARTVAAVPPPPTHARPKSGPPVCGWLLAGSCIIIAGLALAALNYGLLRLQTAQAAAAGQAIAAGQAGEPLARGGFEIYWHDNRLVYLWGGRRCAEEFQAENFRPFLLHITPANPEDLPRSGREHGYENRDFRLHRQRAFRSGGGRCLALVSLPGYPIAEIRTGQYDSSGDRLWEGRLLLDTGEYQAAYESATANPPALRSTFDVYLYGNAVTYIKEPCAAADLAGMFVLHPYPANPGDLPEWRQGQEFDNLDFQFDLRGARFDGKCVASIPLPDYPIDRLRVGQWLPDENRQLWQGEIPVGR